jgi:hypothetical protein
MVPRLRAALLPIVARLRLSYPNVALLEVEDWHEHDGYITSPGPSCWTALQRSLESDATLYAARHADTYVRRAFYPAGDHFLLRFYLLDEDEDAQYPGMWGDFDLCAEGPLLEEVVAQLRVEVSAELVVEPAKAYFDRGYAG